MALVTSFPCYCVSVDGDAAVVLSTSRNYVLNFFTDHDGNCSYTHIISTFLHHFTVAELFFCAYLSESMTHKLSPIDPICSPCPQPAPSFYIQHCSIFFVFYFLRVQYKSGEARNINRALSIFLRCSHICSLVYIIMVLVSI